MFIKHILLYAFLIISVHHSDFLQDSVYSSEWKQRTKFCGEISFSGTGKGASKIVVLTPSPFLQICKLRVTAPNEYSNIKMQFIKSGYESDYREVSRSCEMKIFLSTNPEYPKWEYDLCSNKPLNDNILIPSNFTITWSFPDVSLHLQPWILLNTVMQGPECVKRRKYMHQCSLDYCVDSSLVCDGFVNCPKSYNYGDESFCDKPRFRDSFDSEFPTKKSDSVIYFTFKRSSSSNETGAGVWSFPVIGLISLAVLLSCIKCFWLILKCQRRTTETVVNRNAEMTGTNPLPQNQSELRMVLIAVEQPQEEFVEPVSQEPNPTPPKYEDLEQQPPYETLCS